jgi:2-polyprenyl-3-methyl-5-hydroxy-6-metoxy-1,4-benzoquinol methylase
VTVGQRLRALLGPATDPVARWYRHWYIDLESFGRSLGRLAPVGSVLEIGCGDGHLCEQLVARFPDASVVGIDIADAPGRLYHGPADRVEFRQVAASDLVAQGEAFDLVVMCDVLHHVPVPERVGLLQTARRLVRPGGFLAVKDWERRWDLGTLASKVSDTYVTGERVSFFPPGEVERLVVQACPDDVIVVEGRVPPRRNNQFFVVRGSVPH